MIRLKLWRLQAALTQVEAACAIGIGESSYAILESGRLRPTAGQRDRLCAYFGKQADSLFEPVSEPVELAP
jgi:transcriptional regulator with XRE-family HTH domain